MIPFKNRRLLTFIAIGAGLIGLTWWYFIDFRTPTETHVPGPKKIGPPRISPPVSPPPTRAPSPTPTPILTPTPTLKAETIPPQVFTIEGNEFNFSPKVIHVKRGAEVELTFKNTGTIPHNYVVSDLQIATKTIGAGKTDTVKFTVSKSSGTINYVVYCSVPGHREAGMEGTLIVE